ncbi:unnamed protein product [Mucor fragilis]
MPPRGFRQATVSSLDVSNGSSSTALQTGSNKSPSSESDAVSFRTIRKSLSGFAAPYSLSLGSTVKRLYQRIRGKRDVPQSPADSPTPSPPSSPPTSSPSPLPLVEQHLPSLAGTSTISTAAQAGPAETKPVNSVEPTHGYPMSLPQSSTATKADSFFEPTDSVYRMPIAQITAATLAGSVPPPIDYPIFFRQDSRAVQGDSVVPTRNYTVSPSQISPTKNRMPSNIILDPCDTVVSSNYRSSSTGSASPDMKQASSDQTCKINSQHPPMLSPTITSGKHNMAIYNQYQPVNVMTPSDHYIPPNAHISRKRSFDQTEHDTSTILGNRPKKYLSAPPPPPKRMRRRH